MAATLTVSAAATTVATTAFSTSLRLSLSNFSLPLRRTFSLSSHQFNITFAPTKPDPISKLDLIKPDSITSTRLGDQMFIPWIIRGEDGKLTLQSSPPERLLREMAVSETKAVKTKREKVKAEARLVKREKVKEPEFSKAARRFYNENFREKPQRICKVLAAAGVASRRSSEELVSKGLVTVNGSVCTTPQTKVDPAKDVIYVKGNRLPKKLPPKVYFALNKPKGYICSSGEKETKSVVSLFDDYMKTWDKRNPGQPKPRLFTVGRLDVATTGLIIVTNDGEFAQKLSHPSSNLSKEYIATIDGTVNKRHLITISEGTVIDGTHCTPDVVELLPQQPDIKRHRLRIVVHEGRNHEVRELVKNAGLQMYSLKRVRIGGYRLPTDLLLGKHVELKQSNLSTLGWKNVKAQKPKPE